MVIDIDIPKFDFSDEKGFNESFKQAKRSLVSRKIPGGRNIKVTYYVVCWRKVLWARQACNAEKDRHKRRSRNWGRTERALNNIDVTWAKLINALSMNSVRDTVLCMTLLYVKVAIMDPSFETT